MPQTASAPFTVAFRQGYAAFRVCLALYISTKGGYQCGNAMHSVKNI